MKKVKVTKSEKRRQLDSRWSTLRNEQSSWRAQWQQIGQYIVPGRYREQRFDVNRGNRKDGSIINFVPRKASRALAAGMQTGITSPSRPWFRLALPGPDQELGEERAVKEWLTDSERILRDIYASSNIYNGFHAIYADLGTFCTAAMLIDGDDEDVIRVYSIPVGSFVLACSARGKVDTFMRQLSMTVKQVVELFGIDACSTSTREKFNSQQLDTHVDIVHAIYPNADYQRDSLGASSKPFASDWWELNSRDEGTEFLREAGYEEFPVMAPVWERTGEDVYGRGPGFDALGDCRALQLLERRKAQAIDKVVTPPMVSPVAAQNQQFNLTAGGMNFADSLGAGSPIRPAIEINPQAIAIFAAVIKETETRILEAFYADLWLMLLNDEQPSMTATEVSARNEEKLQQLGAVLEGLHDQLLNPTIDRTFALAYRAGRIPQPPEEIQGRPVKADYISIMAQAQKALATTGLNRLASFVGNISQMVGPQVFDKLNLDAMTSIYADSLGVPPAVTRTDDEVANIRQSRAQEMAQQKMQQQAVATAGAAKDLAQSPLEGENALNEVLRGIGAR